MSRTYGLNLRTSRTNLGTSSSTFFFRSSRPEDGAVLGTKAIRKRACRVSLQLCSNGLGQSLQVTHSNNASSSTSYASCLNSVIGTVHVSQLEPGVQIVQWGNGRSHQKSHCCPRNVVPTFSGSCCSKTRAISGTLFWIFQCNMLGPYLLTPKKGEVEIITFFQGLCRTCSEFIPTFTEVSVDFGDQEDGPLCFECIHYASWKPEVLLQLFHHLPHSSFIIHHSSFIIHQWSSFIMHHFPKNT